jgi:hypothetical protein
MSYISKQDLKNLLLFRYPGNNYDKLTVKQLREKIKKLLDRNNFPRIGRNNKVVLK